MDINKEVAKFEAQKQKLDDKKSKLVTSFSSKILAFIKGRIDANEQIELTKIELENQALLNDAAIDAAYNTLREIK